MIAFLDTEFTDLSLTPMLLSVALVLEGDDCHVFYAEVTDMARIEAASHFALAAVLPQFGVVPSSQCTYAELRVRLGAYLDGVLAMLGKGEYLDIQYESARDWSLFSLAVARGEDHAGVPRMQRIRGENIYNMVNFSVGDKAARVYFKAQELALISRHHALCDARALRISYLAATTATAATAPPRPGLPLPKPMRDWASAHAPKPCASVQTAPADTRKVGA